MSRFAEACILSRGLHFVLKGKEVPKKRPAVEAGRFSCWALEIAAERKLGALASEDRVLVVLSSG